MLVSERGQGSANQENKGEDTEQNVHVGAMCGWEKNQGH